MVKWHIINIKYNVIYLLFHLRQFTDWFSIQPMNHKRLLEECPKQLTSVSLNWNDSDLVFHFFVFKARRKVTLATSDNVRHIVLECYWLRPYRVRLLIELVSLFFPLPHSQWLCHTMYAFRGIVKIHALGFQELK